MPQAAEFFGQTHFQAAGTFVVPPLPDPPIVDGGSSLVNLRPFDPIVFRITSAESWFIDFGIELIYKGQSIFEGAWNSVDGFSKSFSDASIVVIQGGPPNDYKFTLRRQGGWPATPTLRILGSDAAGNPIQV